MQGKICKHGVEHSEQRHHLSWDKEGNQITVSTYRMCLLCPSWYAHVMALYERRNLREHIKQNPSARYAL